MGEWDELMLSSPSRRCVWVNGPIIVGAGPSGLAVAACLKEQGVPFVILERADCVASLWQNRTYDRLKLHLPKQFCQLPGLPFPDHYPDYPTKQQFVDYVVSYTVFNDIHPRFNQSVQSARFDRTSGLWRVRAAETGTRGAEVEYIGRWLVVATGENAERVVPEIAGLDAEFGGRGAHVADYKSGEKYAGKRVLVVGCGNSGMEVCLDLCDHNAFPAMVVRDSNAFEAGSRAPERSARQIDVRNGGIPPEMAASVARRQDSASPGMAGARERREIRIEEALCRPSRAQEHAGEDAGARDRRAGQDSIRRDKGGAAIKRFSHGKAEFVDGRELEIDSVIFATGYRSNVPQWLQESELFGKDGFPKMPFPNGWKGKSGLYAVGFTRRGLSGASSDAVRIAKDIGRVWKEETRQTKRLVACHRRCISQI
uniref:indole-3-pyruvate monooxygenase n=1 Tax=Ananas comosus var. bracteatus TaxID=296719 RepID=A0A6V7PZ49_ANACO|nr:unnamed protein product [Ananas comosus var. bracteatus]